MEPRPLAIAWKAPSCVMFEPAPPQDLLNIKFSLNIKLLKPRSAQACLAAMLLLPAAGCAPAEEARQLHLLYAAASWRAGWAPQFGPKPLVTGLSTPGDGRLPDGSVLITSVPPPAPRCANGWLLDPRPISAGCPRCLAQGQGGLRMWQGSRISAPTRFIYLSLRGRRAWRQRHPGGARPLSTARSSEY